MKVKTHITPAEIAADLGDTVDVDTVYNWLKAAKIKAKQYGGHRGKWIITMSDYEDFKEGKTPQEAA